MSIQPNRRHFLATGLAATMGMALPAEALAASKNKQANRISLAISTYSYWHFRPPRITIETVIDKAAEIGVQGVDVLHQQMDSEEPAYMRKLKQRAFFNGMSLMCLSIHQNFVSPDPAVRQKNIDHTVRCLQLAHEMGIPVIRLNSGRWRTIESFDRLMELRGEEPAIPGYKEDDAFAWCIECIEKCLPKAEEYGVTMALENHWGLTRNPEGVLRILNALRSPWLGALSDTGNFLENPYEKLQKMAPKTVFIQAKTYFGGGEWYTLDLDYKRIAQIFAAVNYRGYVSLEFEGKEHPDVAVPKSISMLRKAFGIPA